MLDANKSTNLLHLFTLPPTGADRWHLGLRQERGEKNPSPLQFYSFQIQYRLNKRHVFLREHKLFHEYICVMYAKVESQRFLCIQQNQQTLRCGENRRICEDVATANNQDDIRSGRKVILPPSFTGGPRYIFLHFQNVMAITMEYDNPQWTEITHSIFPSQQSQDRPDIVARLLHLKQNKLMNDIIYGNVIGRRACNVDLVEIQKRGQPHSDIQFILKEQDSLHTTQEVLQVVTAEHPPEPDAFPDGPQREQARPLEQLVVTHMVHNCSEVCRQQGSLCKKCYP